MWDGALRQARALTIPSEIAAHIDAPLDVVESGLAVAKQQAAAAKALDVAGFKATLDEVETSKKAVEEAADELGVDCAY